MSSPSAAATPSVESLAGPYIFGSLFNWALFGVLSVQVYVYITSFPKDKLWLKGLVYFIFAIEIAQTSLNGYDLYEWFGKGFGDVAGLADVKLSPIDIPLFAAVVSLVVQLFFCYRIWGINSSYWPACVFIVLIALTQATAALYGAATSFIISSIAAAETNRRIVIVWLTLTSVADVLIAAIMTFLLLRARQAEHRFSSDVLTKIVRLVVETNTVTAAMAIITLAVFLAYPDTGYFYTPSVVVGKLYSNTILVSLNNRIYLRAAASRKPLQLGSNAPIPPRLSMSMSGHQRYASLGQLSTSSTDEATRVQGVIVNMTPSNDMETKMFSRPAIENAV